jgi:hypothetical protein
METESYGWVGGRSRRDRAGRRAAEAACEAAGAGKRTGTARRRRRAKRYGEGPMPCGSATTPRSIAAAEKGQSGMDRDRGKAVCDAVCGSPGGRGYGGEPSGATSVRRGQGGARRRSRRGRGKTDTGGAELTRGQRPWPNVPQQRRSPGKEVGNGREPAAH